MRSSAITVVLVLGCLLSRTHGNEEAPGLAVAVTVRVISMPMSTAARLLPRFSRTAESEAAFAELDRLIGTKEAELVEIAMAWADTGGRGTSDSAQSLPYPVDDEGPVNGWGGPAGNVNPAGFVVIPEVKPGVKVPDAFQTRDAGLTVQADVTTNPKTSEISLVLDTRLTRFTGFTEHRGLTSPLGATGFTTYPSFKLLWVHTALRVNDDSSILLGTQVEDDGQRVVIQTLKATISP